MSKVVKTINLKIYFLISALILFLIAGCFSSNYSDEDIVGDYIIALEKEKELFKNRDNWQTKEQVYEFYRQGFTEKIARGLADYSWNEKLETLAPGDTSLFLPEDEVYVLKRNRHSAQLWHKTPEDRVVIWNSNKYTVVTLVLENGVWIIDKSITQESCPDPKYESD